MNAVKKFLSDRTAGDFLTAAACVILIAATILYACTGTRPAFGVTVSGGIIAAAVIAVLLGAAAVVFRRQPLYFAAYLLALYVFFQFIVTQLRYISNVLVAIDGTAFSASFLATAVLMALAWIAALVAALLITFAQKKKDAQPDAAEEEEA